MTSPCNKSQYQELFACHILRFCWEYTYNAFCMICEHLESIQLPFILSWSRSRSWKKIKHIKKWLLILKNQNVTEYEWKPMLCAKPFSSEQTWDINRGLPRPKRENASFCYWITDGTLIFSVRISKLEQGYTVKIETHAPETHFSVSKRIRNTF